MYKHSETGIEFPISVGSFKRGEIAAYLGGPNEKGMAIAYHSDGIEATVFIRHLAPDSRKTAFELVQENLALAKALEKEGKYVDLKIYESDGADERDGWKRAAFSAHIDKTFVMSFIYVKIKEGYAVKLRITGRKLKKEELEGFVKNIQEQVDHAHGKP